MKKRIALTAAALLMSVAMAVPAYAGTWKYENEQWKYLRGGSTYVYNDWVTDKGNYYYMGNDGVMKTGWQLIKSQWYYFDEAGVMQRGWLKDGEKWYFLLPDGVMAVNTVIDGRHIGGDGVWIRQEGETDPVNTTDLVNGYLLQNMAEGLSTRGYNITGSGRIPEGDRWANAIRLKGKGAYVQYISGGQYKLLAGALAPSPQFDSAIMGKVTVYGDNDQVLYTSSDIHHDERTIHFGVDISGQNQIRIEISLSKDNGWDEPVILFNQLAVFK